MQAREEHRGVRKIFGKGISQRVGPNVNFFKIRSKKKREGSIAKEIADCAHSGISVTTSPASM